MAKPNVVTFRNKCYVTFIANVALILIIETAAKLIKDDIKTVKTSHCQYPDIDELELEASVKNPWQYCWLICYFKRLSV